MTDQPAQPAPPARPVARRRATGRPRPPTPVHVATGILLLLVGADLVFWVLALAAGIASFQRTPAADRPSPVDDILLPAGQLALSLLMLVLAVHARRGRRWAWLALLAVLGADALIGLGVTISGLGDGSAPAGILQMVVALVFIALLAWPASSRAYFRTREA